MKYFLTLSVFFVLYSLSLAQDVYINNFNYTYHTKDCEKVTKKHFAVKLKDILNENYKPCSLCHPPTQPEGESNPITTSGTSTGDFLNFTAVIKVDSTIKKEELFSRARIWFSQAFTDSKAVLDVQDKESGELVGNGTIKAIGSNGNYSYAYGYVSFSIKVLVKDGRYKYILSDFYHKSDETNVVSYGFLTNAAECPYNIKCMMCGKNMNNKNWRSIVEYIKGKTDGLIYSLNDIMSKPAKDKDDW